MDTLSHIVLAYAGGWILSKGLSLRAGPASLFILSVASAAIDVEHMYFRRYNMHNAFFVFLVILAAAAFHLLKRKNLRDAFFILSVLVVGHILIDMGYGYGLPLLYPFSRQMFSFPDVGVGITPGPGLEIGPLDRLGEVVASPIGLSLLLYFGLILLLTALRWPGDVFHKTGRKPVF